MPSLNWNTRNSQNPSKYQAKVTASRDKWYGQPQIPLFYLQYAVFHPCSQLEFVDRLFGAEQSLYILSDEWAVMWKICTICLFIRRAINSLYEKKDAFQIPGPVMGNNVYFARKHEVKRLVIRTLYSLQVGVTND